MIAAEWLLNELAAAPNDTQRVELIAAAPRNVREALAALMAYRSLTTPRRNPALDALNDALSSATDDAARRAIINAADPIVVAEFREAIWWKTATEDDARLRYLSLIDS